MNILEELKLSKKQNNDKRYEYLCQNFNVVDYAIKLEKYTIKLQQENKQLKIQISAREEVCKRLESNWNKLKEWVNKHYDYYMNEEDYIGGRLCFGDMKNNMQEIEQGSGK